MVRADSRQRIAVIANPNRLPIGQRHVLSDNHGVNRNAHDGIRIVHAMERCRAFVQRMHRAVHLTVADIKTQFARRHDERKIAATGSGTACQRRTHAPGERDARIVRVVFITRDVMEAAVVQRQRLRDIDAETAPLAALPGRQGNHGVENGIVFNAYTACTTRSQSRLCIFNNGKTETRIFTGFYYISTNTNRYNRLVVSGRERMAQLTSDKGSLSSSFASRTHPNCACIFNTASKRAGNRFPRFSARRSRPRHALRLK